MATLKSRVGAVLREIGLYARAIAQWRKGPAVLYFPSQGMDDGAARLRAFAIAGELRRMGWRSAVCPKQLGLSARRRAIAMLKPDIVVMQTARHPLNRPHLFPGVPIVIDLDDADYIDPQSAEPLIAALSESVGAIAGSRAVARFCRAHVQPVTVIWTGTPPSDGPMASQIDRKPIVTWAASTPVGHRDEAEFLRQVLQELVAAKVDFSFRCYSDDGSGAYRQMVARMVPQGVAVETFPYLIYEKFLQSLQSVAIGLAPLTEMDGFSGGKSFGKILAYVDCNVPVITHPVVDHPLFFRDWENGVMLETPKDWAAAIAKLLGDPALREAMASSARLDLERRLSTETAARLTDRFLRERLRDRAYGDDA
jgi:glycosyltransferase involved in cell wall biosynthesis